MARVHRIGQTKTVQIYKLCTKGTYENHMLKLANQKLGLEHAVMRTGEHTNRELTATGFAKQVPTLALALARALAHTLTLTRTLTPNPNPKQDRTHDVETVAQRARAAEARARVGT